MTAERLAHFCVLMVLTSTTTAAQQANHTSDTQAAPASSITETTYPTTGLVPLRRVERRTESGGRKILIESVEAPGVDGNWHPREQAVTETTSSGGNLSSTRRDVFRFDPQGRRIVTQTTEASEERSTNGDRRTTESTWTRDLNGQRSLTSRRIEETRSIAPGIQQTDTTLYATTPENALQGSERTESTQHQIAPTVVRRDSRYLMRDLNGRWKPVEVRSGETRGTSAENIGDQTVHGIDLDGNTALRDRIITRASESRGEQQVVIETYSQNAEGFVRSDSRLALKQRVRRSITTAADGGTITIEETEARNPQAPNDPMRVVQRTVLSVRKVAPGRWETERQVFERDVNGRFVLVTRDTQQTSDR
jgi:hypothetical protein